MRTTPRFALAAVVLATLAAVAQSQDFQPPAPVKVDAQTQQEIGDTIDRLRGAVNKLAKQGLSDPRLADVEIFLKAADWAVEHDEFYTPDFAKWTLEALDRGLLRAQLAAEGESPWYNMRGHAVIRAYRS